MSSAWGKRMSSAWGKRMSSAWGKRAESESDELYNNIIRELYLQARRNKNDHSRLSIGNAGNELHVIWQRHGRLHVISSQPVRPRSILGATFGSDQRRRSSSPGRLVNTPVPKTMNRNIRKTSAVFSCRVFLEFI